eukprot:3203603-Amphidinium_carterae.2
MLHVTCLHKACHKHALQPCWHKLILLTENYLHMFLMTKLTKLLAILLLSVAAVPSDVLTPSSTQPERDAEYSCSAHYYDSEADMCGLVSLIQTELQVQSSGTQRNGALSAGARTQSDLAQKSLEIAESATSSLQRLVPMMLTQANAFKASVEGEASSTLVAVVIVLLGVLIVMFLGCLWLGEPGSSRRGPQKYESARFSEEPKSFFADQSRIALTLPPTAADPRTTMGHEQPARLDELQTPPPICKSLILPHTEARFVVPIEQLTAPSREGMDIRGTSGRKLLHGA